ncbi:TPA: hypothetical protein P0E34_004744 [Vibrio campbellii]|nr:hypothetical protein [Vibrio campbellii]
MKVTVLDEKYEENATCSLTKVNMLDYLTSLPDDYKNWDIQRGIVNNQYLDNIIDTVINNKHIPPLVLVCDRIVQTNGSEGSISNFKVLDGLQRTYRLKLIHNSLNFINEHSEILKEIKTTPILKVVRSYSSKIKDNNASSPIVRRLLQEIIDGNDISGLFNFEQWIEVWTNLSVKEQVNKMLLLNAGHKSVSKKHQIEIIFHNLLPSLSEEIDDNFSIVKEKEISSIQLNKNRKVGQFSFSNIVAGMISLDQGKAITVNANLLSKIQEDVDNYSLEYDEIILLCDFLYKLDNSLYGAYENAGLRWLGKEVVITGIMGSIGKYSNAKEISIENALRHSELVLVEHPERLNIIQFEEIRNSLETSKINIGQVNKKSVSTGVYTLLDNPSGCINWEHAFKGDA